MGNTTLREEINRELDNMPPELQQKVLDFARALPSLPAAVPGAQLLRFAGTLPDEDAQLMMQAIEDECERIEISEW